MSPLSTFLLTTLLLATTLTAIPIHENKQPHPDVPSEEEQTRVFTTSTTYSTVTAPSTFIDVATWTGKFPPIPTSSWEHSVSTATETSSVEGASITSGSSTWKDNPSLATEKPSPTEKPSSIWTDHSSSSTKESPAETPDPNVPEDPEDHETPQDPTATEKPGPEASCACTAPAVTVTATVTITTSFPDKFQTSLPSNSTNPPFKGTGISPPLATTRPTFQNSTSSILKAPEPTFTPGVIPGFVPGKIYPVPSVGPQKPGESGENSSLAQTATGTTKSTVVSTTSVISTSIEPEASSSVYDVEIEGDY